MPRNYFKFYQKYIIMKIVVLSGAGTSKESGIETFRGSSGTWNNVKIEDVATTSRHLVSVNIN